MRAVRPYLVGIALVAFFTVVKSLFLPLGRDVPFVLYFGAPLVAALTGGRWPGLFTAIVATLAANRFFLGHGNFDTSGAALLQSGAFLVEAGLVALVCDALIHARSRLLAEREAQLAEQRGVALDRARAYEAEAAALRKKDEFLAVLAPDLLPHVFDLFTQGRQSSDRSGGGLGLGLAIARSIVVGHKGTIAARSPGPNQGTTITVKLPLLEAHPERDVPEVLPEHGDSAARKPARKRRRVLIVDDNADGAEMLATLFDQLGYETFIASDAPEALHIAGENLPDAAVLDIGLPGMDGYELAAELRARFGAKTPILVALTGYTQTSDRERALDQGFHAHFGKPVDLDSLATTFEQLFASHHEPRRSELSPTPAKTTSLS